MIKQKFIIRTSKLNMPASAWKQLYDSCDKRIHEKLPQHIHISVEWTLKTLGQISIHTVGITQQEKDFQTLLYKKLNERERFVTSHELHNALR